MTKVIVYHGGYGCDTGCCGHIVELDSGETSFSWDHPEGDKTEFVKELVTTAFGAEHVADIDWENVVVSDD